MEVPLVGVPYYSCCAARQEENCKRNFHKNLLTNLDRDRAIDALCMNELHLSKKNLVECHPQPRMTGGRHRGAHRVPLRAAGLAEAERPVRRPRAGQRALPRQRTQHDRLRHQLRILQAQGEGE